MSEFLNVFKKLFSDGRVDDVEIKDMLTIYCELLKAKWDKFRTNLMLANENPNEIGVNKLIDCNCILSTDVKFTTESIINSLIHITKGKEKDDMTKLITSTIDVVLKQLFSNHSSSPVSETSSYKIIFGRTIGLKRIDVYACKASISYEKLKSYTDSIYVVGICISSVSWKNFTWDVLKAVVNQGMDVRLDEELEKELRELARYQESIRDLTND